MWDLTLTSHVILHHPSNGLSQRFLILAAQWNRLGALKYVYASASAPEILLSLVQGVAKVKDSFSKQNLVREEGVSLLEKNAQFVHATNLNASQLRNS